MSLNTNVGRNSVFKGDLRKIPIIKRVLDERSSWLTEGHPICEFLERLDRKLAYKNDTSQDFNFPDDAGDFGDLLRAYRKKHE